MEKLIIENSAVSIGNFDGFHLGHARIINNLKEAAQKRILKSVILTFSPHPKLLFKKVSAFIHTDTQRRSILESQGIDRVLFIDFREVSGLSPDQFVRDFLIEKCKMQYLVVGDNFRFGKSREGDIKTLRNMSGKFGFSILVVKPVYLDGVRVSSSLIRTKLMTGEIEFANKMLGRPYFIDGMVVKGEKLGRELGFPTINIETDNTIQPDGVFKTKVKIQQDIFDSVTNIGNRPTFRDKNEKGDSAKHIETHILGFQGELYGKEVRIFFERKIRDEIKFDSREGLMEQIKKDIEKVKVDKGTLF